MKAFYSVLLLFLVSAASFSDEEAPILLVPAAQETLHVAVPLPEQFIPADNAGYCLAEEADPGSPVPVQFFSARAEAEKKSPTNRRLLASIPPGGKTGSTRRFQLQKQGGGQSPASPFALKEIDGKSVKVSENGKPRFAYNYEKITNEKVPVKDPRRTRSGYLHPIWGLDGEVLTDDFPRDHYHHHGLFWAWPYVTIGGKHYDLWTPRGIRQDFIHWRNREVGPVAAVLDVENGWFVGNKKVMVEQAEMRLFRADERSQALDVDLTFVPQGEPIALRGANNKGYGGLTIRFNVRGGEWGKDWKRVVITTPQGVSAKDLPETRLAWADLTYPFLKGKPSGAAIFISKDHPDYPPTWLTRHYGPMCVGYPGVAGKTFPPGQPIRLNYRLWIHADAPSPEVLKRVYADYLLGNQARWEK
jgi:hypothetical protein